MTSRNAACGFLLFAALSGTGAAQVGTPPVSAQAPKSTSSSSDLVVARVEGEIITEKHLMTALGVIARQKLPPGETEQQRNVNLFKAGLDNVVIEILLKREARKLNLAPDKAKVDDELQKIAKSFSSPEEFQKALTAQGMTEARLRANLESSMSMQLVIDQASKDIPRATDEEAQKYYGENPKSFLAPERVHAAHVLLLVAKSTTPEQKAELKKKLEGIRADIESKKITFAEAAAKYSQDTGSASKGGDLGFFSRGVMVKPFEDTVFSMQPGSLSQVVETDFGYHIIFLLEKKPAGKIPFEEVKAEIKQRLDQTNKTKVAQRYVNDLKAKAAVETYMSPEEFIKRHPAAK